MEAPGSALVRRPAATSTARWVDHGASMRIASLTAGVSLLVMAVLAGFGYRFPSPSHERLGAGSHGSSHE